MRTRTILIRHTFWQGGSQRKRSCEEAEDEDEEQASGCAAAREQQGRKRMVRDGNHDHCGRAVIGRGRELQLQFHDNSVGNGNSTAIPWLGRGEWQFHDLVHETG